MTTDMLRLRDWPIISFAFFTLGVFAANDFGHGFAHTIGLSFLAIAAFWAVTSVTGAPRKARFEINALQRSSN